MSSGDRFVNQVPEGLPCGQFVYSAEGEQKLLYADINVAHLYGCESVEEFMDYVDGRFCNMVHPEDLQEAENAIHVQTLESGHRHDYLRYRMITKQGVIRYVEDFGHVVLNENGQAFYYAFIVEVPREEFFHEYFNSFGDRSMR